MRDAAALVQENRRFAFLVARRVARAWDITSPEDIRDLEQESLLAMWEAALTWDPEQGAFTTHAWWSCRAACQRALRMVRGASKGARHLPIVVAYDEGMDRVADPWRDLEEYQERAMMQALADEAVAALPDSERGLFLAYWRDGVTGQALADEAGVRRQAVSKKLRRALGRVREAVLA